MKIDCEGYTNVGIMNGDGQTSVPEAAVLGGKLETGLAFPQGRGAVRQGDIAMKKQRVVRGIPVEEGSANVYADLGYPDSESMLVKAQLAAKIAEIIQRRALTQARAAEILGLTQPKVSDLLKGRFRGISEHRLLECLTRLGRDVHIVIKPTPRSRSNGRLTLSVA